MLCALSKVPGVSGTAPLVVNRIKKIPGVAQVKHGGNKVLPAGAVQPGSPDNEVAVIDMSD